MATKQLTRRRILRTLRTHESILATEFRRKHKNVEWAQVAGFRDKLIHHYFGVDWKIVWDVVKDKLPDLKIQVLKILALKETK